MGRTLVRASGYPVPTMIRNLDYDPVTGRLLITDDNRTDTYFAVPLEIYLGLRFARVPDAYFLRRIRGRFRAW